MLPTSSGADYVTHTSSRSMLLSDDLKPVSRSEVDCRFVWAAAYVVTAGSTARQWMARFVKQSILICGVVCPFIFLLRSGCL